MYTSKIPRNRPIAYVIRDYINKKSGKVTASRSEIKRRFSGLDWKDQKKILSAFLDSCVTDREWAYPRLLNYWDPYFEAKVLELWETYHEPKCAWPVIRHCSEDFVKEHISEFYNDRDYYFVCRRLIDDKDFVVEKDRLSIKDYLMIMLLRGEQIDDDEALEILYDIVEENASFTKNNFGPDKPRLANVFLNRTQMMYAYDIIDIGFAIDCLSRMKKDDVIHKFHLWESKVRKAASESDEYKALQKKSLKDHDYNSRMFDIFRKYLLMNLPGRCIRFAPPLLEPEVSGEPGYYFKDIDPCPF